MPTKSQYATITNKYTKERVVLGVVNYEQLLNFSDPLFTVL